MDSRHCKREDMVRFVDAMRSFGGSFSCASGDGDGSVGFGREEGTMKDTSLA